MTKVFDNSDNQISYYLPHHGVHNKSKLRIVFNGSSATDSGVSLNHLQIVKPTTQNDLLAILLRFQQQGIVIGADIVKMNRQIPTKKKPISLQKILWRDECSAKIETKNLWNSFCFISRYALFVQLIIENFSKYPRASHVIACTQYLCRQHVEWTETVKEAI